jgi:hypothetical protein
VLKFNNFQIPPIHPPLDDFQLTRACLNSACDRTSLYGRWVPWVASHAGLHYALDLTAMWAHWLDFRHTRTCGHGWRRVAALGAHLVSAFFSLSTNMVAWLRASPAESTRKFSQGCCNRFIRQLCHHASS